MSDTERDPVPVPSEVEAALKRMVAAAANFCRVEGDGMAKTATSPPSSSPSEVEAALAIHRAEYDRDPCESAADYEERLRRTILAYMGKMGRLAIALFGDENNVSDEACIERAATLTAENERLRAALFAGGRLALDCDEIECDEVSCPDVMRAFPDCVGSPCKVHGWVERRIAELEGRWKKIRGGVDTSRCSGVLWLRGPVVGVTRHEAGALDTDDPPRPGTHGSGESA